MRCLPVMVHFHVNATITRGVVRRVAGVTIVGDNFRVKGVKREVVDTSLAIGPSPICSVVARRRVLRSRTRPLDTVNLHKKGAGRTWRAPSGGSGPGSKPTLRHTTANGRGDAGAPRTPVERCSSRGVRSNVRYPYSRWIAGDVRIPRCWDRA